MATSRALVMGCNGVLGRALTGSLRQRGWHIIGADVMWPKAETEVHEVLKMDTGASGWDRSVANMVETLPELDLVVNVAGGWAGGDIADSETLQTVDEMWKMNVMSSVAAAHIGANRVTPDGLVVLTGALGAMDETPGMISYGVAKAAVHHLVISYGDGLPNGADICAILPGIIDTPNNRSNMPDMSTDDWTPPEVIADEVCNWAEDEGRPSSGALVQIHTHRSKTEFVHS